MGFKSSVGLLEAKGINTQVVLAAQEFLREKFKANPRYSFNNPDIMINHSIQVMDIAIEIASQVPDCDLLVMSLGALFHDIGKAADETPEVLKERHAQFNWSIASEFLNGIELTPEQIEILKNILFEKPETYDSCIEQKIVKEADMITFMKDPILQEAFYNWAEGLQPGNGKTELQKKLDKIKKLTLEKSKELAKEPYENMRNKWRLNNTTQ
jgi:putative nucleotidyltransferase with HDIG domain